MSVIIRLQNLPLSASSIDIRRYFSGLSIPDGGVHIVGGEKGDAFIAFASDDHARQAMSRDGGTIKGAKIELFLSSRSELKSVVDQARNLIAVRSRSRSPPTHFTPEQPQRQQPELHEHLHHHQQQQQQQQSPPQPLLQLPLQSHLQHQPYVPQPPLQNDYFPPPQQMPQQDCLIYMKGIPFDMCTDRDVLNFLSGLKVTSIVFELNSKSGKLAGNAFVELFSHQDYKAALDLNRKHMGRRYIEVFPAIREDMEEARRIGFSVGLGDIQSISNGVSGGTGGSGVVFHSPAPLTPYGPDLTYGSGITGGLGPVGIASAPAGLHGSGYPPLYPCPISNYGLMSGLENIGGICNGGDGEAVVSGAVAGSVVGGSESTLRGGFDDRGGFKGAPRFHGSRMRGGMTFHTGHMMAGKSNDNCLNRRRDAFADGRCVVLASNVCFRSGNEDLREFFADFNVLPNGIERRLNERGLATPEARIAFKNRQEAEYAVKVMHKKTLHGRQIFLRLAM